jgi:hypothetical protein
MSCQTGGKKPSYCQTQDMKSIFSFLLPKGNRQWTVFIIADVQANNSHQEMFACFAHC